MSISLKVSVPGDQQKSFRFSLNIPIAQVCEEIKEKIGFTGSDHQLFQPEIPNKNKARWLNMTYTLAFYQLSVDTHVIFQKIHRPLRVELLDKSLKTVMINDTAKVKDIRDEIGMRLGLTNSEEYGLRVKGAKEGVWLNSLQGLYDQDITPDMILVFDKTYFFTDEQIDRSDPVQLHLIYTKAVSSIVNGQYPTTLPEATLLAGTQAQAMYGDHVAAKHVPGFLKLSEMVPAQWLTDKKFKPKQVEGMIINEWKKIPHTSDVNSKYKYVSTVRKLPTYGITFYTVKMPLPNARRDAKNPFFPLLVGVTKEKILRMNYETKQIEREYPLTHLKRWASLRGKFTFDFGDHEDAYWTVFTEQGDQMSDLIAGYIDIIINNQKKSMRLGVKEEGGHIANVEDAQGVMSIGYAAQPTMNMPVRADQSRPLNVQQPPTGQPHVRYDEGQPGEYPVKAQQATLETLEDAARLATLLRDETMKPKVVKAADRRISSVAPVQMIEALVQYEKGLDGDVEILLNAFAAKDIPRANKAAMNLVKRAQEFQPVAEQAARVHENGPLMATPTLGVIGSIRDLLETARELQREGPIDPAFLQQAKRNYEDNMLLLQSAQEGHFNDKASVALVNGLLKDIAINVDDLIATATAAVEATSNPQDKHLMKNYIKQIEGGNKGLQGSAGVLSQAMVDARAKDHITDSTTFIKNLCDGLLKSSITTGAHAHQIEAKIEGVGKAIGRLLVALETADSCRIDNDVDRQMQVVRANLPILLDPNSGQKQLLDGLKTVATAANEIVKQALAMAPEMPPAQAHALEKNAMATKDLLANGLTPIGKNAIRAPTNPQYRQQLDAASKDAEKRCAELVDAILAQTTDSSMRMAAKQMVGTQFALQSAVQAAAGQSVAFGKVWDEAKDLRAHLENMLQAISIAANNAEKPAQDQLLQAFKQTVPHANKLIAALARVPTNGVSAQNQAIVSATKDEAIAAVQAMMSAAQRYEAADSGQANVAEAIKNLKDNQQQIDNAIFTAQSGFLTPLHNQSYEVSLENLKGFADNLNTELNNLAKIAIAGGDISAASLRIADCAADLISLGEGLAGNLDAEAALQFLNALKGLNGAAEQFVDACKHARAQKGDRHAVGDMDAAKRDACRALTDVLSTARGIRNDEMQRLVGAIRTEAKNLHPQQKAGVDYPTGVKALAMRGKALQLAAQQLAETSQRAPQRVPQQSKMVEAAAKALAQAAREAAGASHDPAVRKELQDVVAQVLEDVANLIDSANASVVSGDQRPIHRSLDILGSDLANLAHATSGSQFPEIDKAIQSIAEYQNHLNDRVPGQGTRQVLMNVENALAGLHDNSDRLVAAAQLGTDKAGIYATEVANEVVAILQAAAAASGPIQGHQGAAPVRQTDVAEYLAACSDIISDPAITNKVGPAAMKIGRLTKDFAATARDDALALANDKERQKNFINASKSISAGLPKLVAAIKANNPPLIQKCAEFLQNACNVMDAARTGVTNDPPVPPPVAEALKKVADHVANSARDLLQASNNLASDPSNTLLSEKLLDANKGLSQAMNKVSDVVKSLDPTMQAVKKSISTLGNAITDLELATVNLEVGIPLGAPSGKSKQECQNELIDLLQSLAPELKNFSPEADPQALCESADHVVLLVPQLIDATRNLASQDRSNAKRLLQLAKVLAIAMQKLANECYVGGPLTARYNAEACSAVGDMLGQLRASDDLLAELDSLCTKVDGLVDVLEQPFNPTGKVYAKVKEDVSENIKALMASAVSLKTCDLGSVATIGVHAKAVARSIPTLLQASRDAIATISDPEAREEMKAATAALVQACTGMIRQAKEVALEDDLGNRADFDDRWNEFTQATGRLMTNLNRGPSGEGKINSAAQAVSGTINKLNSSAIFVSAGQEIEVEKSALPAPQLKQKLDQQTQELQRAAAAVHQSAGRSQDELGAAVENFSKTLAATTETTLQLVQKEPDTEAQQGMINAAKAVAISAKQLILSAKDRQAHPGDSTAAATLSNAAGLFPRAVATFTSVVRGDGGANTSALDAAHANIAKAALSTQSSANATPLAIVEAARAITKAATPLVMGASQSEMVKAADDALFSVQELMANVNGAKVPTPSVKVALQQGGKDICNATAKLVEASKGNRLDPATHDRISEASLGLTKTLEGLVANVNKMPGGAGLSLFGAAREEQTTSSALDEAAEAIKKALASLPIRQVKVVKDLDAITNQSELNDVLVEHARAIAEATYLLVESAGEAERETGDGQKKDRYHNDATWSNGLISASHKAADCVTLMIAAANAAINGNLEEEKLIANAKQVAVSVKQLVVASNVRGISTKLQIEIGDSAKSVARETSDIVATAQRAGEFKMQAETNKQKKFGGASGSMIAKLEQQAHILRLEKQLEEARRGMGLMNMQEYKK